MARKQYVTASGRVVDDRQIQAWADEAERGYDVDELLTRRGAGRPGRTGKPTHPVSVRLDDAEKKVVEDLATRLHVNKADVMRLALRRLAETAHVKSGVDRSHT